MQTMPNPQPTTQDHQTTSPPREMSTPDRHGQALAHLARVRDSLGALSQFMEDGTADFPGDLLSLVHEEACRVYTDIEAALATGGQSGPGERPGGVPPEAVLAQTEGGNGNGTTTAENRTPFVCDLDTLSFQDKGELLVLAINGLTRLSEHSHVDEDQIEPVALLAMHLRDIGEAMETRLAELERAAQGPAA